MSQDGNQDTSRRFELRNFEKNRYFQGKLMTAQDMLSDQQYHANRLETITRLTSGVGIISGLDISEFEQEDDRLHFTVEPGIAIDTAGRPIVVSNPTVKAIPIPEGDEVYIYLEFDTETKDPVPVPGAEPLDGDESEESRILEVFSITATEASPAEYKSPPQLALTELIDTNKTLEEIADDIANAYHHEYRQQPTDQADSAVFLGSFEQTPDGSWRAGDETKRRPYVYDNDLLFSLLLSHISDTNNPHDTRVGEPTEYIESELDQIEGFAGRLQQIQKEMNSMNTKLQLHTEYTTHKSMKTTIRFFDDLAEKFEDESEISRISLQIVNKTRDSIRQNTYENPDQYLEFIQRLSVDVSDLAAELEGETTRTSYQQFDELVDELKMAVDGDTTVIEVARTMDKIGETAEMLEKRTEAIEQ